MAKDQTAWLNDDVDFSKYNSTWVLASGQSFKDSVAPKDAETGFFTVVAVAVDTTQVRNKKGKVTEIKFEVKNDANLNFQYINTGETNPVILSVAAGSTEKYISSGYSPETSFQYTISGAGLTGVIPMVYSQADVEAEGGIESILEDVLSDPNYFYSALSLKENNPSLTASQLADVNDKGFSDIYTSGVTPGTTYYVIVWATNGYDCGVAYDSILTAGDPLPIYKNFTWSDMDPSFAPESEEGLYGTYNLYACETGGSSLRQYIGKAVIADDPDTDDEGPDDNGYYDEYVSVSGLGGSALAKYEMNPSITFDYYASKFLYIATSETSDGVFDLNCFDGDVNAYQQTWADYASYFIPVAEGYWAYIGNYNYYSKSGINFNGLKFVYKNNAYASYYNYLLVDVSVDDNGVAPKAAKASVFAKTDSQEDDVVIEKMPKCPYRVEDVHLSHFFTPAGVKDLQPVVSTKEVAFNHNVDLCSTKNVVDKSNFVPSQSPVNSFNR